MKRAFVIGHPIGHSRSPMIHRYWLDLYGLEGSYEPIDVAPEKLAGFLEKIRHREPKYDFVGGNVTVPLKEEAYLRADIRDPTTDRIGAFNTLVAKSEGLDVKIWGTNTDVHGFLANLDREAPEWDKLGGDAIVLGAGGAARAVAFALQGRAHKTESFVRILNRSPDRAKKLVDSDAQNLAWDVRGATTAHTLDAFEKYAPKASLLVNTTTIGMHGSRFEGIDLTLLPKSAIVSDIVYVPLETPLLADAQALGLKTVDGLGMLLHQAVPGFEAWFGVRPEVTPQLRALVEASL